MWPSTCVFWDLYNPHPHPPGTLMGTEVGNKEHGLSQSSVEVQVLVSEGGPPDSEGGWGHALPPPAPALVPCALSSRGQPGPGSASAERSSSIWQLPRPPSSSSKALVAMGTAESRRPRVRLRARGKRQPEPLPWACLLEKGAPYLSIAPPWLVPLPGATFPGNFTLAQGMDRQPSSRHSP